jgi:hypothetical protein
MKLVIDSLSELKDQLEFGFIVNKLSKKGLSYFNENINVYIKKITHYFPSIKFQLFGYELNNDAVDEENFLIPLNEKFKSFVWSINPVIIYSKDVKDIQENDWTAMMEIMAKLTRELENMKSKLQIK